MLSLSLVAVNGMQAGAGAEASEADNFPMHAVLREFNQSYAAAMTAEAYARYAAAAFSEFMLGMLQHDYRYNHNAIMHSVKDASLRVPTCEMYTHVSHHWWTWCNSIDDFKYVTTSAGTCKARVACWACQSASRMQPYGGGGVNSSTLST